jgi:hypothetical protein
VNFSSALYQLKSGKKITRKIWQNRCLYNHYFSAENKSKLFYRHIDTSSIQEINPFNEVLLTSDDLLAEDWVIAEKIADRKVVRARGLLKKWHCYIFNHKAIYSIAANKYTCSRCGDDVTKYAEDQLRKHCR